MGNLIEIVPGLWTTDYEGAKGLVPRPDLYQINVAYEHRFSLPNAKWLPWMQPLGPALPGMPTNVQISQPVLDAIAEVVDLALQLKKRVVVNCNGNVERAPLTAAWYLYRKQGLPFGQAYSLVKIKNPQAQDRTQWIVPFLQGPEPAPDMRSEVLEGLRKQRLRELQG